MSPGCQAAWLLGRWCGRRLPYSRHGDCRQGADKHAVVCHLSDHVWGTEHCSRIGILRCTGRHRAAGLMTKLSRTGWSSQILQEAAGPAVEGLGRLGLAEDGPGSTSCGPLLLPTYPLSHIASFRSTISLPLMPSPSLGEGRGGGCGP